MDNYSKIFQIAFKVFELKQNAVQSVIEGSKKGGVQRYYMRIPLESAHCNHEVNNMKSGTVLKTTNTMIPKYLVGKLIEI